jgi:hypothetical protein
MEFRTSLSHTNAVPVNTEIEPQISTQLVACFVKSPGRRESLQFFPRCSSCGKVLFNVGESNVAVVDHGNKDSARSQRIGDRRITVLGTAGVFCWECDREAKSHNVPWVNSAAVFLGFDGGLR